MADLNSMHGFVTVHSTRSRNR